LIRIFQIIKKEEKEKFETKIVLENLKYFSKKIGEIALKVRIDRKNLSVFLVC